MNNRSDNGEVSLIDQAGVTEFLELSPSTEAVWIEVIHKMDSVYADLVHSQVELEQKNTELEEAQLELRLAYDGLNKAHEELKQAQQQLVHSEKMASLGRLVAGVAHELNNPISFVFGNMHALQRYGASIVEYLDGVDRQLDPDQLRQLRTDLKIDRVLGDLGPLIEGTMEGAERVSDIVQDLRGYSGNQAEQASEIDLPALIHKATEWVIRASRVAPRVVWDLPDKLEMTGRSGQIHQILVNLVQNALDAMDGQADSVLTLACTAQGDSARIEVVDRGPGIGADDMERIFDPFFTSKPVGQGTGLGLYISYGLARDLGGELAARNHSDGGAVFTLTLPLENTVVHHAHD